MELNEKIVKKALKRGHFPEPFLLSRYALSPYQGCTHGCSYCDGRAEKYYVEGIFDRDIVVRSNLPELLEKERSLLREPGFISIGSGTTDAYLQAENECRITRKLLTILQDIGYPVMIATKNVRLLEDLHLLKAIHKKSRVVVAVSLTSIDDRTLKHFEPGASPASERLDMLKKLKEEGIGAGVLAMPFIPGVTDAPESLNSLFASIASIGVDFAIPGAMTLRPGRQKEHFFEVLKSWDASLLPRCTELFRSNRPGGTPDWNYRQQLYPVFMDMWNRYKIPPQIPHYLYKGVINKCDELFLLLNHMKELYGYKGVDTRPLSAAIKRYGTWLAEVRKECGPKRSLPSDYPDLLLQEQLKTEPEKWLGNSKLTDFVKQVILENQLWDYNEMKFKA